MPIDYSKYPPNWKTEIRPAVLERAQNKCEFCKVPNGALIFRGLIKDCPVYQDMDGFIFSAADGEPVGDGYVGDLGGRVTTCKIVLTIAHLDHDPENHSVGLDRLRALCQRCHLNYDKHNRMGKRKIKEQLNLF